HGCFSVPFLFDDLAAITHNPTIRSLRRMGTVLSPPNDGSGIAGRPIVNLSLALNHAVGGDDPRGYHLFNLIAHALSGLLLFGLVRRTLLLRFAHAQVGRTVLGEPLSLDDARGRECVERLGGDASPYPLPIACAAALLWTVHPLQTESVSCVVQRTELLGG